MKFRKASLPLSAKSNIPDGPASVKWAVLGRRRSLMPLLELLKSRPGGPLLEASWKGSSFIHPTCVTTHNQLGTAAVCSVQFSKPGRVPAM